MPRCHPLAWIVCAGALVGLRADETFQIDPQHASVVFAIKHLNISYQYGRFNQVQGSAVLNEDDPSKSTFEFSAKTESIDTNNPKRDEHLRGPDFFNAKQFPEIRFQSTSVQREGNKWVVTGKLTLHGVTKTKRVDLLQLGRAKGLEGESRIGFISSFDIKRTEFGMN